MSHKFHFAEECLKRLRSFGTKETDAPAPAPKKEETAPVTSPDGCVVVTRTDIGRVRSSNQDAVIDSWPLIGVADGMGGHNGGETASGSTRDLLQNYLRGKEPCTEVLRSAVSSVNHKLYMQQMDDEKLRGMGTTLTVLWCGKSEFYLAHVGDSRCYRLRDGELKQITEDHSVVADMVREGLITKEQAATHPMRNIITRAVATEETVDADILTLERQKNDRYLICSDGLHGMMKEDRLKELLSSASPREAADALLREALQNGGKDNVSLCVVLDTEGAV